MLYTIERSQTTFVKQPHHANQSFDGCSFFCFIIIIIIIIIIIVITIIDEIKGRIMMIIILQIIIANKYYNNKGSIFTLEKLMRLSYHDEMVNTLD